MLSYQGVAVSYGNELALEGFDLTVTQGEIVALVGESGSGKTTAIRAALGLLSGNGQITKGNIYFENQSLTEMTSKDWRDFRGKQMSMIFQDAGAMMNPIRKIGSQFVEYIRTHQAMSKKAASKMAKEMLDRMGLPHSETIMNSYAFQLSGGMRQRVGIAMAMVFQPKILLADEPTSALDVTTQAQIVKEMMDLRARFGTAILLVTHNLGMAAYMADRILVMSNGHVVDQGNRQAIIEFPSAEYTQELLDAIPSMRGERYV